MSILLQIKATFILIVVFFHSIELLQNMRCRSELMTSSFIEITKRLNDLKRKKKYLSCTQSSVLKEVFQTKAKILNIEDATFQISYKQIKHKMRLQQKLTPKGYKKSVHQ